MDVFVNGRINKATGLDEKGCAMDADLDRLLRIAQDTIRGIEENIARCKELCDALQAHATYELIGVQPECTDEELKAAYHRKVAYWHPDKFHAADIATEMRNTRAVSWCGSMRHTAS